MEINARVLVATLLAFTLLSVGCENTSDQPAVATSDSPDVTATANESTTDTDSSAWELVWSDEFDGDKLELEKWKYETGDNGWGNEEWQNYTAGENIEVGDGLLKIIAKKVGEGQKVGDYTSTRLNSKFSFTYGRVEVRAKMPELKGNGLWPAIWTLGENIKTVGWPRCGELDIMEYVSYRPEKVSSAIHMVARNGGDCVGTGPVNLATAEEKFHVYGMDWTETQVKFFIDDPTNVTLTYDRPDTYDEDNWPFDSPQYVLLNLAVGGSWGGLEGVNDSIFPAEMELDYVRVYQAKQ